MDRKQRLEAASKLLRERRATFEITQVIDVLNMLLEDTKDRLLVTPEEGFARLQGEGAAYAGLLRRITRDTPMMTPMTTEKVNG